MPFNLTTFLQPANNNTFPLLEDVYVKGGLRSVETIELRNNIPASNRKAGMLVVTQTDLKIWQLAFDLTTWSEFTTLSVVAPQILDQTSTNIPIDATNTNIFKITLTGNHTLQNPSNITEGTKILIAITQDNIGNRLLMFDTMYKFPSGLGAVLSTLPFSKDVLEGYYDGEHILCTMTKSFMEPVLFVVGGLDFSSPETSGLLNIIL